MTKNNTKHVAQLPELAQIALSRALANAGITGDALSDALDGRLSDLSDTLSPETLAIVASIAEHRHH